MTKRDLFIVFIKLFALFFVVSTPFSIGTLFSQLSLFGLGFAALLFVLFSLIVMLGVFFLLIFNAHKIADKLKLGKGFDDERVVLGQLSATDVFQSTIVILGLYLMATSFPSLLSFGINAFAQSLAPQPEYDDFFLFQNPQTPLGYEFITYGIQLLLGYLMILKHKSFAKIFNDKQEEPLNPEDVLDVD